MLEKTLTGLLSLLRVAILSPLAPAEPARTCATLYTEASFGGERYAVPDGADVADLGKAWRDQVSSLAVEAGCRLRVWEDIGRHGDHRSYVAKGRSREVSWVGEAWRDGITSLTCVCRESSPASSGGR